jgi:hypothetical protein
LFCLFDGAKQNSTQLGLYPDTITYMGRKRDTENRSNVPSSGEKGLITLVEFPD